jgi:hypothetical protein
MPQYPICILYCKYEEDDEYKIRSATLNWLLVFPVWISKVKSLGNVCVPLYLFYFIKNLFIVINCTRLKYTFGIRAIIGFWGTPLWLRVWFGYVISLVTLGDLWY